MPRQKQTEVIVVLGQIVVGYTDEFAPISVGPGGRVTLDDDEAQRLLARGVVRLPSDDEPAAA